MWFSWCRVARPCARANSRRPATRTCWLRCRGLAPPWPDLAQPCMLIVGFASLLLIALTTVIHYEVLRAVHAALPPLAIPNRTKLLVVIFAAFSAHILEIAIYGSALYGLVRYVGVGSLVGLHAFSFENCLYFSAETFTSLGF